MKSRAHVVSGQAWWGKSAARACSTSCPSKKRTVCLGCSAKSAVSRACFSLEMASERMTTR